MGNFKAALSLVKQLQGKPGGLHGFGSVKLVSRRISTVDELELNGAEKMSLHFLVDSIVHSVKCCMQFVAGDGEDEHEAGHFVLGYLIGVLPKRYRIPSMEDLLKDNFAGGKVEFVGFEFLTEVSPVTMTSTKLSGRKHHNELDRVLKWLGFGTEEALSQVKWAAMNTALILRRHRKATSSVAKAMASGGSIGYCIDALEGALECGR